MPCVRRYSGYNITQPLSPTYFRQAYRMKKETFYKLFSIVRKDLAQDFWTFENIQFKKQQSKSAYYIDLKLQLSAALCFFASGDPLDIMLAHGISSLY